MATERVDQETEPRSAVMFAGTYVVAGYALERLAKEAEARGEKVRLLASQWTLYADRERVAVVPPGPDWLRGIRGRRIDRVYLVNGYVRSGEQRAACIVAGSGQEPEVVEVTV